MIEVKYLYIRRDGKITQHYAYFTKADKALRFMFKCEHSKDLVYGGEFSCTDPLDTEYILRRFK